MKAFAFESLCNIEKTRTVRIAHSGAIMYKQCDQNFMLPKTYYPISTLSEHLHSTILRTPKLPEKHTQHMETSFHPPLTLVPLLANYPHSHYSPPFTGSPTFTHPFLVIPIFGTPGVGSPVPLLYFVRSPFTYGFKVTGVYHGSFNRDIS